MFDRNGYEGPCNIQMRDDWEVGRLLLLHEMQTLVLLYKVHYMYYMLARL